MSDVFQQKKASNTIPIKYQFNQSGKIPNNYDYDAPKNFYMNTNHNSFETLQESRESSLEQFVPHEELDPNMRVLTLESETHEE